MYLNIPGAYEVNLHVSFPVSFPPYPDGLIDFCVYLPWVVCIWALYVMSCFCYCIHFGAVPPCIALVTGHTFRVLLENGHLGGNKLGKFQTKVTRTFSSMNRFPAPPPNPQNQLRRKYTLHLPPAPVDFHCGGAGHVSQTKRCRPSKPGKQIGELRHRLC